MGVWRETKPKLNDESYNVFFLVLLNNNKCVRKREIMCVDTQCHQPFASESETKRCWRIDHHKPKNDLPTGRFLCPVDRFLNNFLKRGWLRNFMKTCHLNFSVRSSR